MKKVFAVLFTVLFSVSALAATDWTAQRFGRVDAEFIKSMSENGTLVSNGEIVVGKQYALSVYVVAKEQKYDVGLPAEARTPEGYAARFLQVNNLPEGFIPLAEFKKVASRQGGFRFLVPEDFGTKVAGKTQPAPKKALKCLSGCE